MQLSLKAARINAEITVERAADAVAVSRSTLYNWESGITEPGYKQLRALCELYGVDTNSIK